jgi:ABC-2 type transport system ATP-binding protein
MTPVIQVDGLTKRYGRQTALENVSFEVPPGVVFALLGENGAGKSTCIRILLGLARATSGHAAVLGMSSTRQGLDIRRRVGYVAERPTLYEWMTVDEIGWFTGGFYSGEFFREYTRLAEQLELPRQRRLKHLSKGMRAKVALALALAHDPDLLVLDEPTSGLDTLVRRSFLESMVSRAAEGKTVLLSSHQIGEVERVADIVAILKHGKLVLVERLEKLKAEVQEVTLVLNDPSQGPPLLQGELLRERRRARQWQLLIRQPDRAIVQQLEQHAAIESIELRTPNLEEIFVAYLRRERHPESPPVAEHAL